MERRSGFIRLVFALLLLVAAVSFFMIKQGNIPPFGQLPGDFVLLLPSGEIFIPVTSSIIVSAIITAIAYLLTADRKDRQ